MTSSAPRRVGIVFSGGPAPAANAVIASASGPGDDCVQANPLGGFGFGPWQYTGNDAAYRVSGEGAPTDPCDDPLPELCPTDVNGDGAVNVTDLLTVIGDWGNAGAAEGEPANSDSGIQPSSPSCQARSSGNRIPCARVNGPL